MASSAVLYSHPDFFLGQRTVYQHVALFFYSKVYRFLDIF